MITGRQQKILQAIVDEYIDRAEPISSQFLEKEYDFGVRQAMIRREMRELEDMGYLFQPHTSAGRIPTEKGYRLMVDAIMRDMQLDSIEDEDALSFGEENTIRIMYRLTREMAQKTGIFTLGYLKSIHIMWQEGWQEVLRQPEFANDEYIDKFSDFLEALQEHLEALPLPPPLTVFIGREHPFARNSEFSTIMASYPFSNKETGMLVIAGPMRMPYERSIRLLESLPSFIKKLA